MASVKRWASLVEELQEGGRYTFTRRELEALDDRSEAGLESALRRLKKKGRIASPRRGFYVIVPVEYRVAGSPPPSWFVDDLMAYLAQPYYVGLLTAAGLHGAAHQQPMVFQVVTDRPTRPAQIGRSRIEFHSSHQVDSIPTIDVQTETGTMRVSSQEATAFDLVHYLAAAGHLGNVATVLAELAEELDGNALAKTAALYTTPDSQRLGYLLDLVGEAAPTRALASWLEKQRRRPVPLAPGVGIGDLPSDPQWRVIANEAVEVDV
jgi:predicted transcriptional regulator of viral defense system